MEIEDTNKGNEKRSRQVEVIGRAIERCEREVDFRLRLAARINHEGSRCAGIIEKARSYRGAVKKLRAKQKALKIEAVSERLYLLRFLTL